MAHPLGALYDTPHGVANAIILPVVMEYNASATGTKYKDIAEVMGVDTTGMDQETYRKAAVDAGSTNATTGISCTSTHTIFLLFSTSVIT